MIARHSSLLALDFETTGTVQNYPNQPWQIGLVIIDQGKISQSSLFESWLSIDERPVHSSVHSTIAPLRETLKKAPDLPSLWNTLKDKFSLPIVAHNIGTERTILRQAFPMHSFPTWIDTLKLTRICYPKLHSYALADILESLRLTNAVLSLCPGKQPHDALFDAVASATILTHILTLPSWKDITIEKLSRL